MQLKSLLLFSCARGPASLAELLCSAGHRAGCVLVDQADLNTCPMAFLFS